MVKPSQPARAFFSRRQPEQKPKQETYDMTDTLEPKPEEYMLIPPGRYLGEVREEPTLTSSSKGRPMWMVKFYLPDLDRFIFEHVFVIYAKYPCPYRKGDKWEVEVKHEQFQEQVIAKVGSTLAPR